jgi:hypothetical protein
MLLCTQMINGFNTDVKHDGRVYHVQTEDRHGKHPALESLVYIGGTIIAKKSTSYADKLSQGATEEMIASLLKRQHQVVIAAIKAGRIEELIRHTAKEAAKEQEAHASSQTPAKPASTGSEPALPAPPAPPALPPVEVFFAPPVEPPVDVFVAPSVELPVEVFVAPPAEQFVVPLIEPSIAPVVTPSVTLPAASPVAPVARPPQRKQTSALGSPIVKPNPVPPVMPARPEAQTPVATNSKAGTGSLDLDQVISDYLKRSAEQEKLELKVLTPGAFVAGKNISLRVQVARGAEQEPDAVVTVKIIGTAFKPQVFIGRAGHDGVASFNLALPAFTAGTAAIVIEAQSSRGRGELKHLIRRA